MWIEVGEITSLNKHTIIIHRKDFDSIGTFIGYVDKDNENKYQTITNLFNKILHEFVNYHLNLYTIRKDKGYEAIITDNYCPMNFLIDIDITVDGETTIFDLIKSLLCKTGFNIVYRKYNRFWFIEVNKNG
jgi:hypothetical protein